MNGMAPGQQMATAASRLDAVKLQVEAAARAAKEAMDSMVSANLPPGKGQPGPGDPPRCVVPNPSNGVWTNCMLDTWWDPGDTCEWKHEFGFECRYPDGPIACNGGNGDNEGKFDNGLGEQICTKIKHPKDGLGCARFDFKFQECLLMEGCQWSDKMWCQQVCRGTPGCGVELHRRDDDCQFNCPLQFPNEITSAINTGFCGAWQAGCACIQDSPLIDCASWCRMTNLEAFPWLVHRHGPSEDSTTVAEALMSPSGGYDPIRLCQDACFSRGVCVSAPEPLERYPPAPRTPTDSEDENGGF